MKDGSTLRAYPVLNEKGNPRKGLFELEHEIAGRFHNWGTYRLQGDMLRRIGLGNSKHGAANISRDLIDHFMAPREESN